MVMGNLKIKHLSILSLIYIFIVIGSVVLWAYLAQDANAMIDPKEHRGTLWTFTGLLLNRGYRIRITFAEASDGSTKVSKKAVIAGVTFGDSL